MVASRKAEKNTTVRLLPNFGHATLTLSVAVKPTTQLLQCSLWQSELYNVQLYIPSCIHVLIYVGRKTFPAGGEPS